MTYPPPQAHRPLVAVASSTGKTVDMHLGQASEFRIYGRDQGMVGLIGTRPAPAPGGGSIRWEGVAEVLSDCTYLLVASVGPKPVAALAAQGLTVIEAEGFVLSLVRQLYGATD
ncbi:NifB/NifX family molybdenum-iron cluster-binding protein [Desulfomicrobium baculatum]|uniref:Dinitrogenase iron-molybdenum cofactor biosynthesis protein n=1 Tax=Desulfomicrobium baculatum (strain DSM 4028 / VKM B-1378 / X) TaxID=525897 RepID=C7LPB4_DESBD|nr:NifB/NifX family molybdenum-iron cluster-binding protein [Desulfomicrobium baculatum]ACU88957.1 Dinitrogenase iron-molybdenum cofactor biosynthesis protein [Desulfomicrobium baculatum DSM 4028]